MKVIIDTNLWISFLIGHQTQLVRRMLTDLRFDVYVCSRLIEEIRDVASRDKIRKYVSEADLDDLRNLVRDALACVRESSRGYMTHPKTYRDLRSRAKKLGVDE